jgi:hypothetical protein
MRVNRNGTEITIEQKWAKEEFDDEKKTSNQCRWVFQICAPKKFPSCAPNKVQAT